MSSAGQQLVAGRIPGERIATDVDTGDSSTFTTTETVLQSVTAPLVSGRTYRVRFWGHITSTVANDDVIARLREDSSSGTYISSDEQELNNVNHDDVGTTFNIEREYTATATGNKTFVVTGQRTEGTGTCKLSAGSTRVAYLYVDYISG